ncbi:MAG: HNH endonuclease signature motif containing protein [Corynebacterium sp.]|nr:HNH endonuclease signature motif containing protein [Corynebacterium sp.]
MTSTTIDPTDLSWAQNLSDAQLAALSHRLEYERAERVHQQYGRTEQKKRVRAVAQEQNLHTHEARNMCYAGRALNFPILGELLKSLDISLLAIAHIVNTLRTLCGEWDRPGPTEVLDCQLAFGLEVLQKTNPKSSGSAVNLVRIAVRDHNIVWNAAVEAEARAEYEAQRAQLMENNPEAFDPANLPTPDLPEKAANTMYSDGENLLLTDGAIPEPQQLANDRNVRIKFKRKGRNNNVIVLTGVSDIDAHIIQNNVIGQLKHVPAEERSPIAAEHMGQAAARVYRGMVGNSGINLNVSVNMDVLEKHPEFGVFTSERFFTLPEIFEAYQCYHGKEALLVHDEQGNTVGYTTGRLANATLRGMLQVEQVCCAFPDCYAMGYLHVHHEKEYREVKETAKPNLVLVCPRHHMMITPHPKNFHLHRDLGTSVWWNPETGRPRVGVFAAPHSMVMQAMGKQHGLDPLIPQQWVQLKAILIRETYRRINGAR